MVVRKATKGGASDELMMIMLFYNCIFSALFSKKEKRVLQSRSTTQHYKEETRVRVGNPKHRREKGWKVHFYAGPKNISFAKEGQI